ncbi:MAG: hypothetical protein LH481_06880, partial [Burkholderiales bacterium]|nr:hypothetical protein [Burkholderiales bacterium]
MTKKVAAKSAKRKSASKPPSAPKPAKAAKIAAETLLNPRISPAQKAEVIIEALPYIQLFL